MALFAVCAQPQEFVDQIETDLGLTFSVSKFFIFYFLGIFGVCMGGLPTKLKPTKIFMKMPFH